MTSFLRSLLFAGIASAASLGCVREPGPSNGESGALEFAVKSDATDVTVLATGFATEIDVTRYDSYWQCPDLSKSVPVGTRTADVRAQSCGANPEPISIIDARCDDGACSVATKNDDGSGIAKLVVTGSRDGAATLHVDVKSTTSGATWGDSYAMTFSTPTRVAVLRHTEDTADTTYASLPGASFVLCPELRDASDAKLAAPTDSISAAIVGDPNVTFDDPSSTYVEPGCVAFHAAAPGTSSIAFAAHAMTASATVKVADPNDIVGAELYAVTKHVGLDEEIGASPTLASTPTTSMTMSAGQGSLYVAYDLASVLHLKDGSLALGGAGRYKASYDGALYLETGQDSELASEYLSISPADNIVGDGTLDATFGAVKLSIPFHITR